MHIDCRRTQGDKHFQMWFYKWGFGLWIGRFLFGFGHDTRSRQQTVKADVQPHHFFEYLNPANGPVIEGLEAFETVYAKDQPEYIPLRALRSRTEDGRVMSRWTLTPEQRKAIADGADVYLTLMTFNGPLQPITIAVATDINPDYVRLEYNLRPHETMEAQLQGD
jgi:hypothetical protein